MSWRARALAVGHPSPSATMTPWWRRRSRRVQTRSTGRPSGLWSGWSSSTTMAPLAPLVPVVRALAAGRLAGVGPAGGVGSWRGRRRRCRQAGEQ